MNEELDNVTQAYWASCVRHAEKLQEDNFLKEIGRNIFEPIIINLQETHSDNLMLTKVTEAVYATTILTKTNRLFPWNKIWQRYVLCYLMLARLHNIIYSWICFFLHQEHQMY